MYLDIMESFGMHGYEAKNQLGKRGKGEKTHKYYPNGFLSAEGACCHGCGVFFLPFMKKA